MKTWKFIVVEMVTVYRILPQDIDLFLVI